MKEQVQYRIERLASDDSAWLDYDPDRGVWFPYGHAAAVRIYFRSVKVYEAGDQFDTTRGVEGTYFTLLDGIPRQCNILGKKDTVYAVSFHSPDGNVSYRFLDESTLSEMPPRDAG